MTWAFAGMPSGHAQSQRARPAEWPKDKHRPLARGGVPQAGGGQTAHVVFVVEGHLEAPSTHSLTYPPTHPPTHPTPNVACR